MAFQGERRIHIRSISHYQYDQSIAVQSLRLPCTNTANEALLTYPLDSDAYMIPNVSLFLLFITKTTSVLFLKILPMLRMAALVPPLFSKTMKSAAMSV
jgi:hypothetical protein